MVQKCWDWGAMGRLTVDVRVKGLQPLLIRQAQDIILHHLKRVVVEQDIQATHYLNSFLNGLYAVLLLGEICGEQVAFRSLGFDLLLGVLGILLFLWQVRDEAVSSLHGEKHGGCCISSQLNCSLMLQAASLICSQFHVGHWSLPSGQFHMCVSPVIRDISTFPVPSLLQQHSKLARSVDIEFPPIRAEPHFSSLTSSSSSSTVPADEPVLIFSSSA